MHRITNKTISKNTIANFETTLSPILFTKINKAHNIAPNILIS